MINRLLSKPNRLLPFSIKSFSQQKEDWPSSLSAGAQKALWAQKIINKIAYADNKLADDITKPSFRQLIIQCQNPIKGVAFEDNHKKEVIKMFESGINLNKQAFAHQGIVRGQNEDHSFTFCPNLLATRTIFQRLITPSKYKVFHGCSGMGKTISIIMFIELSRHIHKYIYDAVANKIQEEEYKMLLQRRCINQRKKYWYWSINQNDQLKPGHLQAIIAAQATQLSQKQRLEIRNSTTVQEASQMVRNFYRKTYISQVPIVDHINKLATLMRKWNAYEETHRKNIESHQDFENASLYYNKAIKIKEQFKQFIDFSPTKCSVLNSSTNLEWDLLFGIKDYKSKYEPLGLVWVQGKHQIGSTTFSDFHHFSNIVQTWGKNDFWQSYWFEFSRKITQTISNSALQQLRKCFLNYVNTLDTKQYYNFLEINIFLNDKVEVINEIAKSSETKQQRKQIATLMTAFDKYCYEKSFQKAYIFFTNSDDPDNKRDFLRAMYVIALTSKIRGYKDLIISMNKVNVQVKTKGLKPFPYFQVNEYDNQLIPYQKLCQFTNKIKIQWGTVLFCKIIGDVLYKQFPYQKMLMNRFQNKTLQDKIYFGTYVEGLIAYQLQKGTILQLMNVKKKIKSIIVNGQKTYYRDSLGMLDVKSLNKDQYQIASVVHFDAFPLKEEQYSSFDFEQSLASLIAQCDERPNKWVAGIPFCSEKSNRKEENIQLHKNPRIDFILAKRKGTKNNKKYILNCVDVTILSECVFDKEQMAHKLYSKLLSSSKYKFQISHVILCPRQRCLGFFFNEKSQLSVIYSNIEAMKFVKSQYPNQLALFEVVQKYLMLENGYQYYRGRNDRI